MSRWLFHTICCTVLLIAIVLDATRSMRPLVSSSDPLIRLVKAAQQVGLSHVDKRRLLGGEEVLTFLTTACSEHITLLYMPSSHPESTEAHVIAEALNARRMLIHDGELIEEFGQFKMMRRMIWRRVLVALRLKSQGAMDATMIIIPSGCDLIKINWAKLARETRD